MDRNKIRPMSRGPLADSNAFAKLLDKFVRRYLQRIDADSKSARRIQRLPVARKFFFPEKLGPFYLYTPEAAPMLQILSIFQKTQKIQCVLQKSHVVRMGMIREIFRNMRHDFQSVDRIASCLIRFLHRFAIDLHK